MMFPIEDLNENEKEKPKVIRPKPLKKGKGEERRRQLTRENHYKRMSDNIKDAVKKKASKSGYKSPLDKRTDAALAKLEELSKTNTKPPPKITGKLTIPMLDSDYGFSTSNSSDSDEDDIMALQEYLNQQRVRQRMRRRQENLKGQSGGKRRRKKKTRKRKGKGKGKEKKYGNLKFREIKKPTFDTNIERVYGIDLEKLLEDELKNQKLEKEYNKTIEKWKNTPFYKRKKKSELAELANQLEFQLRNRQAREMDDSLIQTTNPEKQHYAKLSKDKDGNIIIPKGLIVSSNTKSQSKTRKKGMQVLRMRAAAEAQRKIGGRRSRKKRKKLMCPKNCCGVPVDKCGCPVSCPHCNCPEIKRLRKLLKKTRKKCNKKRKKKTSRKKGGKKVLQRYIKKKPNALRRTIIQHEARQERIRRRQERLRLNRRNAIEFFRRTIIDGGQLHITLTNFIHNIRAVLSIPQYRTRERYDAWSEMLEVLNEAVSTREISMQDRRRIDLIGTLLEQYRSLIEPNFDTAYLGHDSSSDEEATTENVD